MNFHTRLVGAFDAIILSALMAVMFVMMVASLHPSPGSPLETLDRRATVTIEQIA